MPEEKEDRAIVRDYLEIVNTNRPTSESFTANLIESLAQSLFTQEDSDSQLCSFVVTQAGEYYLRFKLSDLATLGECAERGYEKGKQEIFKSGITGAFIIAHLEALLCLTEKDKCAGSGSGTQFSYGLANGLLQQLNIPEMRDAVIELIKTTTITKWSCLFNPGDVKRKLTDATDPKEIVKILTGCLFGIEVDVAEANLLFETSWQYVKSHYTEPYLQGQATAFIVTLVLPPAVKALQASKLGQLLKNARAGIVKYIKNSRNLEGLENGLDEVVEGVAKGGDVPTGLVSKITQQGSAKLKSWLSSKPLSYADNTGARFSGAAAETKIFDDLDAAIGNKRVLETLEDGQGRLSIVLERPGQTNQVVSIHPTSTGDFKMTTFEPAYNPSLNPDIPAPVSASRLVPDYSTTNYLHPQTKGKTIRIEMKGNRNSDFKAANEAGGFGSTYSTPIFTKPDGTVVQYTWHHLDDFEVVNGKAYCTMQLVETTVHGGTGVTGMAHSGSVAQWRAFFGSGY